MMSSSRLHVVIVLVLFLNACVLLMRESQTAQTTGGGGERKIKEDLMMRSTNNPVQRADAEEIRNRVQLARTSNTVLKPADHVNGTEGTGVGAPRLCLTGMMRCGSSDSIREYIVDDCAQKKFTVPELYRPFSAHQVEWNIFGKTKAFWSVITRDDFLPEKLTEAKKDGFYGSGKDSIQEAISDWGGLAKLQRMKEENNGQLNVLDFGCGVGRLSLAFAQTGVFSDVTCVDQSTFHLNIATEEYKKRTNRQWARMHSIVSTPDMLAAVRNSPSVPKEYHYVFSVLVLQHMITPLQVIYLEQLCDLLALDGATWIQIPTKTTQSQVCSSKDIDDSIRTGGMQMHYCSYAALGKIMARRGCDGGEIQKVGDGFTGGGYPSSVIKVRKRRLVQ